MLNHSKLAYFYCFIFLTTNKFLLSSRKTSYPNWRFFGFILSVFPNFVSFPFTGLDFKLVNLIGRFVQVAAIIYFIGVYLGFITTFNPFNKRNPNSGMERLHFQLMITNSHFLSMLPIAMFPPVRVSSC